MGRTTSSEDRLRFTEITRHAVEKQRTNGADNGDSDASGPADVQLRSRTYLSIGTVSRRANA